VLILVVDDSKRIVVRRNCNCIRHMTILTLPSHEEEGLVTIEQFLGCAESTVLILDKPMK